MQSRLPIYEQLAAKITELVLLGKMKPGERLFSVRAFARDLGINPNTVQRAYQELERDGVIYSVPGRGSYVGPAPDLMRRLGEGQIESLKLAARQARRCAVPEAEALEAVRQAYGEDLS